MWMAKHDDDLQQEMINAVDEERKKWEDALVHITENVAFRNRDLIKTLRKNYWGIYDNPTDPTTGRRKLWIPLTEQIVETGVKQTDFDPQDMKQRATTPEARPFTQIVRAITQDYTDKTYFGEDLNTSNRQLHIDGTFVWKVFEKDGLPRRHKVDLLNCYIDPTAESIQEAPRFTERILMTPEQVRKHGKWINTDEETLSTSKDLDHVDDPYLDNPKSEVPLVDVWEMWGRVPEYFITGNVQEDTNYIEAQIVISGLEAGEPNFHYARRNTKEDPRTGDILKPYEECWETKVQNRWYGRGMAEKVMMLQLWLNTTVNIRMNRSFLNQMGIFKIRKGSGITPEQLQNLPQNGGIVVNSMDDIENFALNDMSASAFNEEQSITQWAQKVSSAFDHVAGAQMPAETPATNASIQNENAMGTFKLVQDNIDSFLQRFFDRHVKPVLFDNISADDVIRLTGDDAETKKLFDRVAAKRAEEALGAFEEQVYDTKFSKPSQVEEAMEKVKNIQEEMKQTKQELIENPDTFVEVIEDVAAEDYMTRITFTSSEVNTSKKVTDMLNMLQVAPELKEPIVNEVFDLLDMDKPSAQQKAQVRQQQQRSRERMEQDTEGNRQGRANSVRQQTRNRRPQPGPQGGGQGGELARNGQR